MKLSIIIPAHNEGKRINNTLEAYTKFFDSKLKDDYELFIVPNGCRDDTVKVVSEFSKKHKSIKYKELIPDGKGNALKEGFRDVEGNIIGFIDADNSTNPEEFYKLIESIDGFSAAIASRWMKTSEVDIRQPIMRIIAGRAFNLLVRFFLGLNFYDTQCGAKVFKKEAIKSIYKNLGTTKWAFDIDLLYQIKRKGYSIKEVPIRWSDTISSSLNILKASLEMFLAVVRLRLIYSPFAFIIGAYDLLPERIKIHHRL